MALWLSASNQQRIVYFFLDPFLRLQPLLSLSSRKKRFSDFCLKLSLRIWFLTVDISNPLDLIFSPKIADDFKALLPYLSYLWRNPCASEKSFSDSWIAAKIMFLPPGLFSGCALTQVSSVYPCGSHSYLLCCRHVFENCSCSGLFLRGCNYHAHGLITAISWSWRQGGLGLCIASVKFLNCSCLEPRRPPCLLQADLFFCCKVLPPNPSPCSSPDALGGVFVSCCVVYLTAWPGTWW